MTARRLVLLRHAKAERADDPGADADRPLAPKGRVQAVEVGKAFTAAGIVPQVALVSTALRTRQTWDLLARALRPAPSLRLEAELYHASVAGVLTLVRDLDAAVTTVLVVGHEPIMAATAAHLAGPGSSDAAVAQVRVGVPTATWSLLEADGDWGDWGRGAARLVSVARPG